MTANQVALAYLLASILFILSLRGLSHPLSARRGNLFGMIGMALAILTTLAVSRRIDLAIGAHQVNFTGETRTATLANGTLPGPILRWREGDDVTLCVRNDLGVDTTIHWHGVLTPSGRRRHTAALLSASSSSDVRRSEETAPTASREARTPCRTSCVP